MLKLYSRHVMIIDKVREKISFRQRKWLEKYRNCNTHKRNQAVNDFEKDFYILFNNAFFGTMENIRNRVNIEVNKNDEKEKIIEQFSKPTFNRIHQSYTNYDSYTFKQNEVLLDEPIYLGFAVIELSKILMYETDYDKIKPSFGQKNTNT